MCVLPGPAQPCRCYERNPLTAERVAPLPLGSDPGAKHSCPLCRCGSVGTRAGGEQSAASSEQRHASLLQLCAALRCRWPGWPLESPPCCFYLFLLMRRRCCCCRAPSFAASSCACWPCRRPGSRCTACCGTGRAANKALLDLVDCKHMAACGEVRASATGEPLANYDAHTTGLALGSHSARSVQVGMIRQAHKHCPICIIQVQILTSACACPWPSCRSSSPPLPAPRPPARRCRPCSRPSSAYSPCKPT